MPHSPASGLPHPFSYDASEDGVVLDNVTGLMWQSTPSPPLFYEDAAEYCSELDTGERCDWRIPTRIEMVSLLDHSRSSPAIDTNAFSVDQRGAYLTSSEGSVEGDRWVVDVRSGTTVSREVGDGVLCVRSSGEHSAPSPRYQFEGQGAEETVTDLGTGLVWQRAPSSEAHGFSEAQDYCASLALPGDGWRVPSIKELQTLLDETQPTAPRIDPEVFPEVPILSADGSAVFWSSTLSVESPASSAWFLNFDLGRTLEVSGQVTFTLESKMLVRCVR